MSQSTSSRPKLNPSRPISNNGSPAGNSSWNHKGRAKSVPADVKKDHHASSSSSSSPTITSSTSPCSKLVVARRSLPVNKPKSGEKVAVVVVGSQSPNGNGNGNGSLYRLHPVGEQLSSPRRTRRSVRAPAPVPVVRRSEEDWELKHKLELSEGLVKDLRDQVLALKQDLDKARAFNKELESHNMKLLQDLAASQAQVAALTNPAPAPHHHGSNGEYPSPKFKDTQKLIAYKLEHSVGGEDMTSGTSSTCRSPPLSTLPPPPPLTVRSQDRGGAPSCPSLPPPPPPLPPLRPVARSSTAPKAPAIVEFYQSLRKQEEKRDSPGPRSQCSTAAANTHSSIVGEIQNRSAHLLAIKVDVETKGDFINGLIQKVLAVAYTDIEDVLSFVDWLDGELSALVDERAVLKHFNWPERKADAIREAAIEYRGLKLLEGEISSYKDDESIPYGTALKKMAVLLEKSDQSIQRLIKLRSSVMPSYQDWKIPTNWMLDTGIVRKIKQSSMNLARMYLKRVVRELDVARKFDRESNQEALVLQGVQFAYKAHQFAGGLDSETMCAFEEIRKRVPGRLRGTQELLAAIPSS